MTAEASETILGLFLIFCRVGACLMLLPGYSNAHIPANVRLFVAFGISLSISPGLLVAILPIVKASGDDLRLQLIVTELLNGVLIGLLGRVFMLALQFAASFIANAVGMGQALGVAIEESDPVPALVTLITLTAVVLVFAMNLHAEVILAILASYRTMPVETGFAARASVAALVDNLGATFTLCLRIAAPFVVYAVIVNFAIGLANKMTPQIPVYFISLPFVLAGGLILLGYSVGDFLSIFMENFQRWVLNG